VATIEEYARRPREERMTRVERTPAELADAIKGASGAVLERRPAARAWAANEVICHLRDNEEWFLERMKMIVAMDLPRFIATNPDRWAEERQYLTNDAGGALAAFRRRRAETLETFGKLTSAQWEKGGVHPALGRITLDGVLSVMAWHDDNHLDQLTRALAGASVSAPSSSPRESAGQGISGFVRHNSRLIRANPQAAALVLDA